MDFALRLSKIKHNFLLVVVGVTLLLAFLQPVYAQSSLSSNPKPIVYAHYPKKNSNSELVRKGEYLAQAGDCLACHTNAQHGGHPYAGGLPFKTPFGTYFSPNITPDKKTGIGNWTEAQFARAMREGIAPDGSNYFPVFPYNSFSNLTNEDLRALKAYLMSIPPVVQKNKETTAPWPFSWRFAQWGWKILFQHNQGPYKPNHKKSSQWNRGAYLVEGLAHCGECHTPRNFLGGVKQKYALTGAMVEGYYAANITAPALKSYSIADILKVFLKNEKLGGRGKVGGPMAEVNIVSLQYLSKSDLEAIAVYIKSVNSAQPPIKHANGKISAEDAKDSYEENCAVCHDVGAAGAPKLSDAVEWSARVKKQGIATVYDNAIHGLNSMPAMGGCTDCSPNEIKAVVDYMLAQAKSKSSQGELASGPRPLTMKDGKRIYDVHCAVCHDVNAKEPLAANAPKIGNEERWTPILHKNIDVLVFNTIRGYRTMPANGGCKTCSTAEIKAAVKYIAQKSQKGKNYLLW